MTTTTLDHAETVEQFLASAVRLEADAARRFDELADAMNTLGNEEVAAFFRQMAEFSRLHLADAKARAGFRDIPEEELPGGWQAGEGPESADWTGLDGFSTVRQALETALEAEKAGHAFYAAYLDHADPEIRAMAQEFTEEEAEHVEALEGWLARHKGD